MFKKFLILVAAVMVGLPLGVAAAQAPSTPQGVNHVEVSRITPKPVKRDSGVVGNYSSGRSMEVYYITESGLIRVNVRCSVNTAYIVEIYPPSGPWIMRRSDTCTSRGWTYVQGTGWSGSGGHQIRVVAYGQDNYFPVLG